MPAAQAHDDGHLPGARGPRHLPGHDGDREPGDGLLPAARRKRRRSDDMERVFTLFPRLAERRTADRWHVVGRRAADAGHRAGAHGPAPVLLLDEPSMGLAPMLIAQIFDIITRDQPAGHDVLLSSRTPPRRSSARHRAYVLETGTIVKSDDAANLLDDPAVKPYLEQLTSGSCGRPARSGTATGLSNTVQKSAAGRCSPGQARACAWACSGPPASLVAAARTRETG